MASEMRLIAVIDDRRTDYDCGCTITCAMEEIGQVLTLEHCDLPSCSVKKIVLNESRKRGVEIIYGQTDRGH